MYKIGIDIGGTNVKAAIIDVSGNIVKKSSIKTDIQNPYTKTVSDIAEQIKQLLSDCAVGISNVSGIGMGVPGSINSDLGIVCYSNNIGWDNVPLGAELKKYFNLPIKLSNDANVAALGEATFGAGKKYRNVIMLTLGTGVGGGIIIDKKLYEGNEGKGAELGHVTLVLGGEQCTCGRKGCIEAYCSATALVRDTKRKMHDNLVSTMWDAVNGDIDNTSARTAFDCAKTGDTAAQEVVDHYIAMLSESIMNYCNIFRPDAIVLGGGVSAERTYLTDRIKAYCQPRYYGFKGTPEVEIATAELGNDAGVIGAACLIQ